MVTKAPKYVVGDLLRARTPALTIAKGDHLQVIKVLQDKGEFVGYVLHNLDSVDPRLRSRIIGVNEYWAESSNMTKYDCTQVYDPFIAMEYEE